MASMRSATACIRRFASASASMARNDPIAPIASGAWAEHEAAANPRRGGGAEVNQQQVWSRSSRPKMMLKMNHKPETEPDDNANANANANTNAAKVPPLTAIMSKPLEEYAGGAARAAKPVVSLTDFDLRKQRLASLAAEFAAAELTQHQSQSVREQARRKCNDDLIELINEALADHKHRLYDRHISRLKKGYRAPVRSDYDVERDSRELCNLARFYDARFKSTALPLALRLYTAALAGAKLDAADFDKALKLFTCFRSAELLLAAASCANDVESAMNVMKRADKFKFRLRWSAALRPFILLVIRRNDPAIAMPVFSSPRFSSVLMEMPILTLNRLLPLAQNRHGKYILPTLLRRLEKEEKWTRRQYQAVLFALLRTRDADALISVYERWSAQSLAEPQLRDESTIKLFLHVLLVMHLLRPYRELVNLYPMLSSSSSSSKDYLRPLVEHLFLEAFQGDLANFHKAHVRVDMLEKKAPDAQSLDATTVDQLSEIQTNLVVPKVASHVLAYSRAGRIDDPEAQKSLSVCRSFGLHLNRNAVLVMKALYISNRVAEAIEFGRLCVGSRVPRTYLSWLLLYTGANPSSLLSLALNDMEEQSMKHPNKSRLNFVRPQQFGSVFVSHVLNGDTNALSKVLLQMQELQLGSSFCCDLAVIAGRAIQGDVGGVRRLYAELDSKIDGLWNYQRPHPEVVWTDMEVLDGRQYYDAQLLRPVFDANYIVRRLVPDHTERALRILTTLEPSDAITRHIRQLKTTIADRIQPATTELITFYFERTKRQRKLP